MTRPIHCRAEIIAVLACLLMSAGWSGTPAMAQDAGWPDYQPLSRHPTAAMPDRQADARRQPAKLLAFAGVQDRE